MQFAEFARICEHVEGIPGRLEMIEEISRVLSALDTVDLPIFVQFVTGKIFPDWSPLKLGIGPNLLFDAITLIVDGTRSDVIAEITRKGDVGLAVQAILERKKVLKRSGQNATIQTSLFTRELDLAGVFRDLEKIARMGGKSSQQEKLSIIQNLFQSASPLEGRYLARLLMEDLRIGVGEGTMRDAIARAFSVDSSLVEHAYQARNDLGEVARLARIGEDALKEVHDARPAGDH
jgi:DNA ligase-1